MKKIKLDEYELKLVIHSLNELRNSLISENKDFEIVDELLMKYILGFKKYRNRFKNGI